MKKLFLISIVFILSENCFAQDIHFSQFSPEYSGIVLNPATAGAFNGNQRVIINYKDQWRSIAMPYKTYSFSGDIGFLKKKFQNSYMGLGLFIFNDIAGDTELGTTQANISLSYHILLNKKNILTAGLQGGFAQRSINNSVFQWDNQYDGTGFNADLPSGESIILENYTHSDFGAGILWHFFSKDRYMTSNDGVKINLGMSILHINRANQTFYQYGIDELNQRIVVHVDASIGIKNTDFALLPGGVFYKQYGAREILFGTLVRYRIKEESKYTGFIKETAFSLGGYYRLQDAFIIALQFEIANYAIGISYDVNISGLQIASNGQGGIEISLRYIHPNPFRNYRGNSLL